MFSQSDSEFSLCSAVQSIWFRFEEDAAYQKMEKAFLFCAWCGCQLIDWLIFIVFFEGMEEASFVFCVDQVVILYLCLGWKRPVCLGMEDASFFNCYDWVDWGDRFDGNVYLGMEETSLVSWFVFDVDVFYLWKADSCFVFLLYLMELLLGGCTKPVLFCIENVDLTRVHYIWKDEAWFVFIDLMGTRLQ